ncbi:hypothetical protein DFJ77DRAFT_472024 [Powellomyces hirtus]|nr:hypothetical protein DFJ77DRAFT_472024 [Powellomyces hirtus]
MDSAVVTETSTPVDSAIATGTCTPSELSETGYERPSTPSRIDLAAVEARELQVRLELERIVREGIEVRRAREIAEAEQRYSERLARLSSGQAALEELIAGVLPSPVRHQTDASGVSADFQFREELLSLARAGVESVRARAAAADEESLAQRLLRIQALRGNGRENSLERMGTPRYPLPPILCPPDLGDHFPEPPPIVRPPGPALFQMLGKAEMHIAPAISYNLHILSLGIEADEAMARAAQSQQQTILEEDTNRGGEGSSLSPPPTTNSNTNRSSNKRRRENDDDEEEDSALSSENQLTSEHEREGPAAAKRARQDFAHTR